LIESGMTGTRLLLSGRVLTLACAPVAGATLDFWQADAGGTYDNSGYRLRGNQLTDAAGRYHLETIVPGEYPGRTEHIHVKVRVPGKAVLTTQLYFPGVARNQQDSIFDTHLLVTMQNTATGRAATFDFVTDG
jgi:protocatechuate 3,4-dioxygenase beta subunit